MFRDWRKELLEKAEKKAIEAQVDCVHRHAKVLKDIEKALELKKQIIAALRKEPNYMFGEDDIYIETDDFHLAHDVAKALEIELKREAGSGYLCYKGEKDGVHVDVYGIKEAAGCRVIAKKVMREIVEYEVVCNEEKESGTTQA